MMLRTLLFIAAAALAACGPAETRIASDDPRVAEPAADQVSDAYAGTIPDSTALDEGGRAADVDEPASPPAP